MSWMRLLNDTYENVVKGDTENLSPPLLPIAHSTQKAQIEVLINVDGEFINASVIEDKEDSNTLIPVTEESASRSGKFPVAHPLCDKLQYLAGDYTEFGGTKGEKFYLDYIEDLRLWSESEYINEKVVAIFKYLKTGVLISDLVKTGVLFTDDNNKLLEKWTGNRAEMPPIFKVVTGFQSDAFIRFRVSGGKSNVTATWQDKQLHDDYIKYYSSRQSEKSFCYATGQVIPCSDNHPSKIRNTGDKAKLISANDSSGFTYRGRFQSPEQAVKVGYEVSQKSHNALKWLIQKQGKKFGDKVFLLWGTNNEDTPDVTADSMDFFDEGDDSIFLDTKENLAEKFNMAISGYKANINNHTELALLGLDSATTGRLSITFYRKYKGQQGNELIDNINLWHKTCEWGHFYKFKDKKRIEFIGAPSPKDIALIVYGTEQNGFIKADDKIVAATVQRILPCICDGANIPYDIVSMAIKKAFHPQSYSEIYNWEKVLSITCSLVRKFRYDYYNEEDWTMDVKENGDDLNYNCGRLLAIADAIENWALGNEKRTTNAMRYFTRFSKSPCETWGVINDKLNPYKQKLGTNANYLYNLLGDVSALIDQGEFAKAKNLDGRMALGFDAQRKQIINYTIANKNKNKENKED
jgi:CRISPR-associated protein Csd1